jgi:copper(I)-binding protein
MMLFARMPVIALLSVFILVSGCSQRSDFDIRKLTIREMPPGRNMAVAYFQIENFSAQPLVFNYVHSPVAESVEVHEHVYEQGKMKMRPVAHLSVAGNSQVNFAPGGYHLMLLGVQERLLEGDTVELTFEFNGRKAHTMLADVRRM